MDISVLTPGGWQAPVFQPLAQQSIVPVQSTVPAMASGLQSGLSLGAPLAHAAESIADGIINGPLNQQQRSNALAQAKLQGRTLTRQGKIQDLQDQYLQGNGSGTAAPLAGSTPGAPPAPDNSSTLPQPDQVAPAPPALIAAPAPTPSAAAQAAPGVAATPAPAPAPVAPQPPAASGFQSHIPTGGFTDRAGNVWFGTPMTPGSVAYNDAKFGPGFYGKVDENGGIVRTPIPVTRTPITNKTTGQEEMVTMDEQGNVLQRTPLSSASLPPADLKFNQDWSTKGTGAEKAADDLLTSVAEARRLYGDGSGYNMASPLFADSHGAMNVGGRGGMAARAALPEQTGRLQNLQQQIGAAGNQLKQAGVKTTNRFEFLAGQSGGPNPITDAPLSYKSKLDAAQASGIESKEYRSFVDSAVNSGQSGRVAEQQFVQFMEANPAYAGGQLTRQTPLPIQAMTAPVITSDAQMQSIPVGGYFKGPNGVVHTRTQ